MYVNDIRQQNVKIFLNNIATVSSKNVGIPLLISVIALNLNKHTLIHSRSPSLEQCQT